MRYARRHSGRSPRLLVGLERRVVFTLTDREAPSAPAYEYWRTLFREVAPPAAAADSTVHCQAGIASLQQQQRKQQQEPFPLTGWRLDVGGVPQALQPSQRSEELELWELTLSE